MTGLATSPGFVRDLTRLLGESTSVVTDSDVLDGYRRDRAPWAPVGMPAVMVAPTSVDDVRRVMAFALDRDIPVVPRGAGSGLSGGANAVDDCIILSMHRYNSVTAIRSADRLLYTQAGALNAAVKAAARTKGLWYPPDPASSDYCSIGGNVATNAGGLCCVKYGVTRDWVQQIAAVLPGGDLMRAGHLPRKGVAGYDLAGLLVGSEGTLAVITDVTLRLRAPAAAPTTVVATFPLLRGAGTAIEELLATPATPSLLEIVDRTTLRAVEDWKPMGLDLSTAAMLVLQYDNGSTADAGEAAAAEAICLAAGASLAYSTNEQGEAELLLAARRLAYPALERSGLTLLDDVAVPPAAVATMLAKINHIARLHRVLIGTFGHAGDGNLHPTIVVPHNDAASAERADAAFNAIMDAALSLGGTVTGEHGVGILKAVGLAKELDPVTARLHTQVKRAFDPTGILNPGKGLPVTPLT